MYLDKLLDSATLARGDTDDNVVVLIPTGLRYWADLPMIVSREAFTSLYVEYKATEPDLEVIFAALQDKRDRDFIGRFADMDCVKKRYTTLREALEQENNQGKNEVDGVGISSDMNFEADLRMAPSMADPMASSMEGDYVETLSPDSAPDDQQENVGLGDVGAEAFEEILPNLGFKTAEASDIVDESESDEEIPELPQEPENDLGPKLKEMQEYIERWKVWSRCTYAFMFSEDIDTATLPDWAKECYDFFLSIKIDFMDTFKEASPKVVLESAGVSVSDFIDKVQILVDVPEKFCADFKQDPTVSRFERIIDCMFLRAFAYCMENNADSADELSNILVSILYEEE